MPKGYDAATFVRSIGDQRPDLNELLTVDDVARLLKVSRGWVYEHTRGRRVGTAERLPHIKIGKYVHFDRRALYDFL